jgi:hypothetical protein
VSMDVFGSLITRVMELIPLLPPEELRRVPEYYTKAVEEHTW